MSPEHIYARLSSNPSELAKRPLLRDNDPLEALKVLSEKRQDKYSQADVTVKVDPALSPIEMADKVIQEILEVIEKNPPLWQSWKSKRDQLAVEAAARVNTTRIANVFFVLIFTQLQISFFILIDKPFCYCSSWGWIWGQCRERQHSICRLVRRKKREGQTSRRC
jgi:hypothetical protein